jgi:serine/threonine protein kinase
MAQASVQPSTPATSITEAIVPSAATPAAVTQPPQPASDKAAAETVHEISSGTVLRDRYVIEHVIGIGGNSVVFQARDRHRDSVEEAGERVALKVLRPQLRTNPYALMRMRREFRQMQRLTHQGIARVFDLDCDNDLWFMTLELVEGQTITQWMKGTGTDAEAMRIIMGCCEAVSHAHSCGIVHGDLKPSNVLVLPRMSVKLVDFGSAAAEVSGAALALSARSFAATPPYASPQILTGNVADPRDDVFSLACIAYAVLTRGEHPFERKSSLDAVRDQMRPAYSPKIQPRVFDVIVRALSWQRQNRPASAREFLNALAGNDLGREHRASQPEAVAITVPAAVSLAPSVVSTEPSTQVTLHSVCVTLDIPQSRRYALPTQWLNVQSLPSFSEWSSEMSARSDQPPFDSHYREELLKWVNASAAFNTGALVQVARPEPHTIEGTWVPSVPAARAPITRAPVTRSPLIRRVAPLPSIWHRHGLAAVAVIGVLAILLGHQSDVGSSTTPAAVPPPAPTIIATEAALPAIRETTGETAQPTEPNIVEHVVPPPPPSVAPGFISFESPSVQVGANQSMAVLTVKRLDSTRGRAKIAWTIEGASGRAAVDETAINSQTIQFLDGQDVRSLYIPLVQRDDPGAHQPTRTFIVKLSKLNGSPAIGPLTQTKVTIASGY